MSNLLWNEVRDLNREVPHLITSYRMAAAAVDASAMAVSAMKIKAAAGVRLAEIGNRLASELVCSCTGLEELVSKFVEHRYFPSLRAAAGSPEKLLADIYDLTAERRGLSCRAYRQGYDADGNR